MYRISSYELNMSKIKAACLAAAECDNYSPLANYVIKYGQVSRTDTFDSEDIANERFINHSKEKGTITKTSTGLHLTAYALEQIENKKVKEILKTCSFKNALKI